MFSPITLFGPNSLLNINSGSFEGAIAAHKKNRRAKIIRRVRSCRGR